MPATLTTPRFRGKLCVFAPNPRQSAKALQDVCQFANQCARRLGPWQAALPRRMPFEPTPTAAADSLSFEAITLRFIPVGVLALVVMATPVFAWDAGDTVQGRAGASTADKDNLLRKLDALSGLSAARNRERSCLDGTLKTTGHSNLPISEVAKACSDRMKGKNI